MTKRSRLRSCAHTVHDHSDGALTKMTVLGVDLTRLAAECASRPTSSAKNPRIRQDVTGPEPHTKYTRPGAQEGGSSAFLCNLLEDHVISPSQDLHQSDLAHANWVYYASVKTFYATYTKYWPRTVCIDTEASAADDSGAPYTSGDSH